MAETYIPVTLEIRAREASMLSQLPAMKQMHRTEDPKHENTSRSLDEAVNGLFFKSMYLRADAWKDLGVKRWAETLLRSRPCQKRKAGLFGISSCLTVWLLSIYHHNFAYGRTIPIFVETTPQSGQDVALVISMRKTDAFALLSLCRYLRHYGTSAFFGIHFAVILHRYHAAFHN